MARLAKKTLALIAHDGKKADMVACALSHRDRLLDFELVATVTTGRLLEEKCGLTVMKLLSGPIGGDAQIASMVAEGKVEAVFFLSTHLPNRLTIQTFRGYCGFATSTMWRWQPMPRPRCTLSARRRSSGRFRFSGRSGFF